MWWRLPPSSFLGFNNALRITIRAYASKRRWSILFFGTDDFSLVALRKIHQEYASGKLIDKLEVVTNKGTVEKFTKQNGLTHHTWPVDSSLGRSFDLGVVVSFGHLIPKSVIESFSLGIINVHASLLPRWRGAAPIIHCLMNGDKESGVSIMRIKPHHFDIGDIVCQKSMKIPDDMRQIELYDKLATMGSHLLIDCLHTLPECFLKTLPQNESEVTLAPKISKSITKIDWHNCTARQIYNLSRALYGIYPLVTKFKNYHIRLKQVFVYEQNTQKSEVIHKVTNKYPGQFEYDKQKNVIKVWCKDGEIVSFNSIQIKGKSEMSALEFKNGFMKKTPQDELNFRSPED